MVTPLDRPLRRAVTIGDAPYVVTISNEGLKLVQKGHRKGVEISWQDVLEGEPTLRAQLQKSLDASGTAPKAKAAASHAAPTMRSEPAEHEHSGAPARGSRRAR
jgi:hypothetical protein